MGQVLQRLCPDEAEALGRGRSIIYIDGVTRTLVGAEFVRLRRRKGLWVTFDKLGEYAVAVPYAGSQILVPISFCASNDIRHVLSYRWAGAYGQQLQGNDAPIDFFQVASAEKHNNEKQAT